ncbi:DUF2742 domain-containing protein [Mycobacteroides abscessus subsp. abscessus]|nr:DUF2742 domain-containing protein [Mycobacteroides abscessus subsp. abscessus]
MTYEKNVDARPESIGAGTPASNTRFQNGFHSNQVCWTTVLEFVERRGIDPVTVMLVGTPEWNQLPDDHPDKLSAVLAAGVHHALRLDLAQEHRADASHEISAAADWTVMAQRIRNRDSSPYVPRRAS